MPEADSQKRKELGSEAAKAMVSAILSASPRIDSFSTWLMGITTGFLLLLFANIERTVTVIKIGPVRALIVVLTVSTVIGLLQKLLALLLQIEVDMDEAADRKMAEAIRVHAGQTLTNPVRYFQENADIAYMLAQFVSAFPEWIQKHVQKLILSPRNLDLSNRQKATKRFAWQCATLILQVTCALVTIGIVLFSL
jgi:hypothetical protein